MSEFELQQLFIATRWEFDIPTLLFVFVSLGFVAAGPRVAASAGRMGVLLWQIAYVFCSGFCFVRAQAAIVRASRLTELLVAAKPSFTVATPSFQMPTYLFRYGSFAVLFVVTLVLLQWARGSRAE